MNIPNVLGDDILFCLVFFIKFIYVLFLIGFIHTVTTLPTMVKEVKTGSQICGPWLMILILPFKRNDKKQNA